MKTVFNLRTSLLLLALSCPSLLFAQTEKDWTMIKRMDAGLGVMTCTAITAVAESKIPVQAEVILPETDEKAPLILVKAKGLNGQVAKAYVRPDGNTAYTMLLLNSDPQSGEDTFVLSPQRINEAIKIIIERSKLDIYFGEGVNSILARLSLRGSSVTLNRAAACRTSKQLLNQAFFSELRDGADAVAPQQGDLNSFLASYQELLAQINQRSQIQSELQVYQQTGVKLKNQLASAQQALANAVRNEQSTILEINNLKQKISDLQASLAKAQADLPGLKEKRPAAAQDVKNAEAALAPYQSEVNRLNGEISIAQRDLNNAKNAVANLESNISALDRQIRGLESQTDQLRSEQDTKSRQLADLRSRRNRLQSDYNFFDESRRVEEILREDYFYQNERRDLDRNIQKRQQLPSEIEMARSRMLDAQRDLETCKAGAPPVNCSAQQSAYQRAQRDFENKRNELQSIDQKIERNRARIRDYELEATRKARDEKQEILRAINQLDVQISELENRIAEIDRKIRDIQSIDIPRLQRQADSYRNQLATAQSQVTAAGQRVRQAKADLDRYKQSVGYDQLVGNLTGAQSRLNDLDQQISVAQNTIQQVPAQITSAQSSLQSQEQELVRRTQARIDAEAVAAQAQKAVDEFSVKENEIKSRLIAQQNLVAQLKANVQGIGKGLFGF